MVNICIQRGGRRRGGCLALLLEDKKILKFVRGALKKIKFHKVKTLAEQGEGGGRAFLNFYI